MATATASAHPGQNHGGHHDASHYVRIWGVLLVLFAISVCGPLIGIRWLTLITAFGIAIVKATIVAAYFMHLNVERKLIWYMLLSMLLMVGLFYAGTMVDVSRPSGENWVNSSYDTVEQAHSPGAEGHHEE